MNPKTLSQAISSAQSVKLGLASNPESSSAWVKTLIDPAHAREYGCRGIPDENQQPTLVLNGRVTSTYYSGNLVGGGLTRYVIYNLSTGSWMTTNTAYKTQWSSATFLMLPGVARPLYVLYYGTAAITSDGNASEAFAVNYIGEMVETKDRQSRVVAESATLSWIAQELNRGGYVEAGYWLPRTVLDGDTTKVYIDYEELTNLVTYTGTSDDGCYIVSSFNDYDMYRYWKGKRDVQVYLNYKGYQSALDNPFSDDMAPQGYGGMRPFFITYHAFDAAGGAGAFESNPWGLRLTMNQVVETMCPYKEGGSDSAVYDHASVEDMIALYDSMDLIFPARYNDWKKVWSWIKQNASKAPSLAASVMRHFPTTRALGDALAVLVGDLPRNYHLMSGISHLAPTATNGRALMMGGGSATDGEMLLTKRQKRVLKTRAAKNKANL